MSPTAIPFHLSPRSFVITIFVLILAMLIIRIVIRQVQSRLPDLKKAFSSLTMIVRAKKLDETVEHHSASSYPNWPKSVRPETSAGGDWDVEWGGTD
jgi:hypothetical protein